MEMGARSIRVSAAFVKLADTLVGDYDVLELLHTLVEESVELLNAAAAGLMLASADGELQVLASTSEESQLVEALQQESGAGPCVDCYVTGLPVIVRDIAGTGDRWTEFRKAATSQGFRSVHAFPLRVRGQTIGAMNLFRTETGDLSEEDIAVGQALADVSTISILQKRTASEFAVVNQQLQDALNSRILIEQAKGMIAQIENIDTNEAFQRLRSHARSTNQNLRDTAEAVLNRSLKV